MTKAYTKNVNIIYFAILQSSLIGFYVRSYKTAIFLHFFFLLFFVHFSVRLKNWLSLSKCTCTVFGMKSNSDALFSYVCDIICSHLRRQQTKRTESAIHPWRPRRICFFFLVCNFFFYFMIAISLGNSNNIVLNHSIDIKHKPLARRKKYIIKSKYMYTQTLSRLWHRIRHPKMIWCAILFCLIFFCFRFPFNFVPVFVEHFPFRFAN